MKKRDSTRSRIRRGNLSAPPKARSKAAAFWKGVHPEDRGELVTALLQESGIPRRKIVLLLPDPSASEAEEAAAIKSRAQDARDAFRADPSVKPKAEAQLARAKEALKRATETAPNDPRTKAMEHIVRALTAEVRAMRPKRCTVPCPPERSLPAPDGAMTRSPAPGRRKTLTGMRSAEIKKSLKRPSKSARLLESESKMFRPKVSIPIDLARSSFERTNPFIEPTDLDIEKHGERKAAAFLDRLEEEQEAIREELAAAGHQLTEPMWRAFERGFHARWIAWLQEKAEINHSRGNPYVHRAMDSDLHWYPREWIKATLGALAASADPVVHIPERLIERIGTSIINGDRRIRDVGGLVRRVDVHFNGKPAADVIDSLKRAGFRWDPVIKSWWAPYSTEAVNAARSILGRMWLEK